MSKNPVQPPHPGEILRAKFMEPNGLSATALAKALGVTPPRINDILLQRRGISGNRLFGWRDTSVVRHSVASLASQI